MACSPQAVSNHGAPPARGVVKASAAVPQMSCGYSVSVLAAPDPASSRQISPPLTFCATEVPMTAGGSVPRGSISPRAAGHASPPRVLTRGTGGYLSPLTWADGPSPLPNASSPHRPRPQATRLLATPDGVASAPSPRFAVDASPAGAERLERSGTRKKSASFEHLLHAAPRHVIGVSTPPGENLQRSASRHQAQSQPQLHPSPRPAAKQHSSPRPRSAAKVDHPDGRSRLDPQSFRRPSPRPVASPIGRSQRHVDSNGAEQAEPAVSSRLRVRRFSRGSSLTRVLPGSGGGDGREETDPPRAEGDESPQDDLPSGLRPYVPAEMPYFGPVPTVVSSGSRLRLIAFDFDQTLAATHLFFRLKNQQSRSRASEHGGQQHGRHGGPALTRLLLHGVVPFEEIWGGQERLDYLKAHLQELSRLGVFMVIITKGAGRVVDLALQLAGIREHFQMVLDPNTSTGAKLMTLQVLMNTALSERLRPMEAVLVDDDLKNLVIDISAEEVSTLPPVFQAAAPAPPSASCLTDSREFREGHLVGPVTVCRLMRVEHGVKAWQLRELVEAATYG